MTSAESEIAENGDRPDPSTFGNRELLERMYDEFFGLNHRAAVTAQGLLDLTTEVRALRLDVQRLEKALKPPDLSGAGPG